MSYITAHRFSLGRLAAACVAAVLINGSVLLGFDHLAQSSDAPVADAVSQLAGAASSTSQAAL